MFGALCLLIATIESSNKILRFQGTYLFANVQHCHYQSNELQLRICFVSILSNIICLLFGFVISNTYLKLQLLFVSSTKSTDGNVTYICTQTFLVIYMCHRQNRLIEMLNGLNLMCWGNVIVFWNVLLKNQLIIH